MKYVKSKNKIEIIGKDDFNPAHIFECGQVFCFAKSKDVFYSFPQDKFAQIIERKTGYEILTTDVDFFENYFDLKTDYTKIKKQLLNFEIMKKTIKFGSGIRILKQDLFETTISFIISANNNIKRIQLILNRMRNRLGKKIGEFDLGAEKQEFFSFPSYENLLKQDLNFFTELGAGYRDKYLYKLFRQATPEMLSEFDKLSTPELRKQLLKLYGIGPKVADCILLFGYGRVDVFPVDTWINQMYDKYFQPCENREKIRNNLVNMFGDLAGFAQQYLFYYQRSENAQFKILINKKIKKYNANAE